MDKNAPRYIAIYHELKADILSRRFPTGSYLPTEGELIERFSASRTTIRKAIALLKDEHLVNVQQGRGTEVLSEGSFPTTFGIQKSHKFQNINISNRFLVEGEQQTTTQGAEVDIVPAEIDTAKALGIDIGTLVYRLQRVKLINDMVFAYVVNYVPLENAPGLESHSGKIRNLYDFLFENYDVKFKNGEETVSAALSGFLESKLLNVNPGTPILVFNRIAHCRKGILEYSKTIIRPDLYKLVISIDNYSDHYEQE